MYDTHSCCYDHPFLAALGEAPSMTAGQDVIQCEPHVHLQCTQVLEMGFF